MLASVQKTGKVVVAYEGTKFFGGARSRGTDRRRGDRLAGRAGCQGGHARSPIPVNPILMKAIIIDETISPQGSGERQQMEMQGLGASHYHVQMLV